MSFRILPLFLCMLLTACNSSDELDINDIIVGTWDYTYTLESEEDVQAPFAFVDVVFRADHTCGLTYDDAAGKGEHTGTYEAGNAFIRIDYQLRGESRSMLWQVLAFTERSITVKYKIKYDTLDVIATVQLSKKSE